MEIYHTSGKVTGYVVGVGGGCGTSANAEGMLWFTALIFAAHGVRGWLRRPSVHRAIDRVTGTVLIGFGVKLALSPR